MRYQFVEWLHEFEFEPVVIVQELTDDGWEVRKIEIFPSGSAGFASSRAEVGGSILSDLPSPTLDEINQNPEFKGIAISSRTFEALWRRVSRTHSYP